MAHRDNTCAAKLCFVLFPFSSLFYRFLSSNTVQLDSLFTKMLKTCTCLSVCKIRLFPGPDLRENLQSTITFADSKTENKPVKASTTVPPGPDCISCIFFQFTNLAILIVTLPLFFNRSLEEGKIGIMAFWDGRFNYTVRL